MEYTGKKYLLKPRDVLWEMSLHWGTSPDVAPQPHAYTLDRTVSRREGGGQTPSSLLARWRTACSPQARTMVAKRMVK